MSFAIDKLVTENQALAEARALLNRRHRTEQTWPALAAAALFATSATAFAVVTILAPVPAARTIDHSALRE